MNYFKKPKEVKIAVGILSVNLFINSAVCLFLVINGHFTGDGLGELLSILIFILLWIFFYSNAE